MKFFRKKWPIFTLTLTIVLFADQITKALARAKLVPEKSLTLIKGILSLDIVKNAGSAFGLLKGNIFLFQVIAFTIIIAILLYLLVYRPASILIRIALGLIVAGSIGNFIDRAFFKQITDFINLHYWPVFNVADSSVVVGTVLLFVKGLFSRN